MKVTFDNVSIGISAMCAVHCVLTPFLLTIVPALAVTSLAEEVFHQSLIFIILPLSVLAFFSGCRKHRRWHVFGYGVVGITVLVFAAFWGHDIVGEVGERVATVIGSGIIAVGHLKNARLCRRHTCHA